MPKIVLLIFLPIFDKIIFIKNYFDGDLMKSKIKEIFSNTKFLFWLIIFVAIALRIGKFFSKSSWLNQDEASIGYDAFALLNYGIDRNGMSFPIHLVSWGSGQNALYAYLSMPFIAIFGLCSFSVRIVNFIAVIGSIAAIYHICRDLFDKKVGLIAMALTAISPWSIMISVWGLESNLFPSLFVFGLFFLVKAFKKPYKICLSAAIFSLCLYSYGSAYVVVPVFLLLSVILVLKNKLIPLKWVSIAFGIFVIMSIPIGLFVLINKFGWSSIHLGPFTIPSMAENARINELLNVPGPKRLINNILDIFVFQNDKLIFNTIPPLGWTYIISIPFTILGFFETIKSKNRINKLILFAFISAAILIFFLADINSNRINGIFIPIIVLTAAGINSIITNKTAAIAVLCSYLVFCSTFTLGFYSNSYAKKQSVNQYDSLGEAIKYADSITDAETIYVTDSVNMPYIYVLFYTQENPHEYIKTVKYSKANIDFNQIKSFGKWEFNIDGYSENEPGVYIIDNKVIDPESNHDMVKFKNYSVVTIE